jgi:hypothetical protein
MREGKNGGRDRQAATGRNLLVDELTERVSSMSRSGSLEATASRTP